MEQFKKQLERFLVDLTEEITEIRNDAKLGHKTNGIQIELLEHTRLTKIFLQILDSGNFQGKKDVRKEIRKRKRKNDRRMEELIEDVFSEEFYKVKGIDCCLNDIRNLLNRKRYMQKK